MESSNFRRNFSLFWHISRCIVINKTGNSFEIVSKLSFFFDRQPNFVLKQTFSKKKLHAKIIFFCLHNVILDAQKFSFFSVSLDNFSKMLKTPIYFVSELQKKKFVCKKRTCTNEQLKMWPKQKLNEVTE